jgi:hypothetical protein
MQPRNTSACSNSSRRSEAFNVSKVRLDNMVRMNHPLLTGRLWNRPELLQRYEDEAWIQPVRDGVHLRAFVNKVMYDSTIKMTVPAVGCYVV